MCTLCNGKSVPRKTFKIHCAKTHASHLNSISQLGNVSTSSYNKKVQAQQEKNDLQKPLYEGSSRTLIEAISEHFLIFSSNSGMSKAALTECLQHEKRIMPQPNYLPASYKEAVKMIKPSLIPIKQYKCCVNDCKIYPMNDNIRECSVCDESLLYKDTNRCKKTFSYMPVVPRLARWFGTKNLAKILYAKKLDTNGKLCDYTDGQIFQAELNNGIFKDTDVEHCVPLALFTDGVNPNKNNAAQKSMWPIILTWISLPQEIRYLLGPMMLVGIIPGNGRKEPKSLDPYITILVDELLSNMECQLYDSHKDAPVTVKIALLQYLCDIPAFAKLLHLSGQAALRSCTFCKEVGVRNNSLNKTIHISNRQFLSDDSAYRLDCTNFALKTVVNDPKPAFYSKDEEMTARKDFDLKPNKNQKTIHQKETGLRGIHPLYPLPYFDRLKQMQTDGMHTISDVISNVLDFISGKTDSAKVRNCEKQYNRFEQTWVTNKRKSTDQGKQPKKKQKKQSEPQSTNVVTEEEVSFPDAPWSLSKSQVKLADKRAQSIQYPRGFDYTPADHFTRQWTLRTMHGKQQFVTQNAASWCLRGLLGQQQEKTLFQLFDVLSRLVKPSYLKDEIPTLIEDTHIAVTLLERDFPLTLQNLTTHLLHHIPEGFMDFGPLYDRWLYPLERANSWITRQILQHGHEESTVMQTYCIYDWSVFNLLNGTVKSDSSRKNALHKVAEKVLPSEEYPVTSVNSILSNSLLQQEDIKDLHCRYKEIFPNLQFEQFDVDPTVEKKNTVFRYDEDRKREVYFTTYLYQSVSRSCDYIVCVRHPTMLFGKIKQIYQHCFMDNVFTWVRLDVFPLPEASGSFWFTENVTLTSKLCLLKDISNPIVTAVEDGVIWFLNA
ncbi:uncharacterized protein LOC134718894 [Mytilus trossulus]|uniref:uncharacterized protein LOC134718894 n=1 Tax=Mytilus trossulus TaxID=6551 RepID=UPI003005EFC2